MKLSTLPSLLLCLCTITSSLPIFSSKLPSTHLDDAYTTIQNEEQSIKDSSTNSLSSCAITAASSCPISAMSTTTSTLVNPGSGSRCLFSDSGPFQFQVWKGSSTKLLLYFQGGGACWDETSTELGLCSTSARPSRDYNIFCRGSNCKHADHNIYSEYTIIQILYCSGDAFVGNVTRPYNDSKGLPVTQTGALNTQKTLDYIMSQEEFFSQPLTNLVLMGCSAGALGVQAWSDTILRQIGDYYGYERADVFADSYAGVFPPGVQGPTIKSFGACTTDTFRSSKYLTILCNLGQITLQEIMKTAMSGYPDVTFAHLNSKEDEVQIAYYVALAATSPSASAELTPERYYYETNLIFESYAKFDNAVQYLVQSKQHCYTCNGHLFVADGSGSDGGGGGESSVKMIDWVTAVTVGDGAKGGDGEDYGERVNFVCVGKEIEDLIDRPSDTKYCDENLVKGGFTLENVIENEKITKTE